MKRINIILIVLLVSSVVTLKGQIKVDENGDVGIKTLDPQYSLDLHLQNMRFDAWTDLYFDWSEQHGCPTFYPERDWYFQLGFKNSRVGTIWAHTIHSYSVWQDGAGSDGKGSMVPLAGVLNKLSKITGVKYSLPDSLFAGLPEEIIKQMTKEKIGFIPEQIEKVFPQVVISDKETATKYIDYSRLIPVLLEAVKEQQKELEYLYSLNGLSLNKSTLAGEEEEKTAESGTNKLYQNTPNPFDKTTEIKYELSGDCDDAALYIFNMTGTLLKTYKLNSAGEGFVTINEGELKPGMYFYTLVCNGTEVDTKKMILTD